MWRITLKGPLAQYNILNSIEGNPWEGSPLAGNPAVDAGNTDGGGTPVLAVWAGSPEAAS